MKAVVYWFSGTGNSRLLASHIAQGLTAGGLPAELKAIEDFPKGGRRPYALGSASEDDGSIGGIPSGPEGLDLFCFPVFSFTAPAIVDRFISRLPVAIGRKAAIVATMGGGGYEGRTLRRAARMLKEAGREVVYSTAIEMPEAFVQFYAATEPIEAEARTAAALGAADKAIQDILSGKVSLRPVKAPGLALTWIASVAFKTLGRRILGQTWCAQASCTSCGLCAATCPARTIVMAGGRPHWGASCQSCQRCANLCPVKAIKLSWPRLALILAPIFVPYGRLVGDAIGATGGFERFLLWVVGMTSATVLMCLLLRLLDFVPGIRRFLSLSPDKGYRRSLASGFAAELGRRKRAG